MTLCNSSFNLNPVHTPDHVDTNEIDSQDNNNKLCSSLLMQNIASSDINSTSQKINIILMNYLTDKQIYELYEINTLLFSIFNDKKPHFNELNKAQRLLSLSNEIMITSFSKLSLDESLEVDRLMSEQFSFFDKKTKYIQINSPKNFI
ncbi:hypothetical protein KO527_02915 [Pseudoalteromonas sp. C2R02]|uniref:hypothetical protein n=1 Tax=Pseudoalteromonas sp. C2R02 TaxID=2841565 RepID=UPI001C08F60C|nr:hypothetical protein [Pseudoalteromonas sp. C2R02]MBU2968307.1 hypothetical protein [Pseudoalteromonas sp. C2R02]